MNRKLYAFKSNNATIVEVFGENHVRMVWNNISKTTQGFVYRRDDVNLIELTPEQVEEVENKIIDFYRQAKIKLDKF